MKKRPLPDNPPEWTEIERWVIETLGDHSESLDSHSRSLGVIEGILKVMVPLMVGLMIGLLAIELR